MISEIITSSIFPKLRDLFYVMQLPHLRLKLNLHGYSVYLYVKLIFNFKALVSESEQFLCPLTPWWELQSTYFCGCFNNAVWLLKIIKIMWMYSIYI